METSQTQMVSFVERILLATDCSAFSEGAEQEAIFFAQACNAELTILHIIEDNPEFSTIGHATVREMEVAARDHLEKIHKMAENEDIKAEIVIRHSDDPVEVINDEVLKRKIDIVITGRRGRRGLKRLLMGVVTEKVASMVPCKTLIVPKDFVLEGDGVLLATDGSAHSEHAENEAINMVSRCDYLKYICVLSAAENETSLEEAKKRVQRISQSLRGKNKKIAIESVAEIGDPCDLIVRKAREKKVDVIIVGTHGRTGLHRMLMGSVCSQLIAVSPCSVLITK